MRTELDAHAVVGWILLQKLVHGLHSDLAFGVGCALEWAGGRAGHRDCELGSERLSRSESAIEGPVRTKPWPSATAALTLSCTVFQCSVVENMVPSSTPASAAGATAAGAVAGAGAGAGAGAAAGAAEEVAARAARADVDRVLWGEAAAVDRCTTPPAPAVGNGAWTGAGAGVWTGADDTVDAGAGVSLRMTCTSTPDLQSVSAHVAAVSGVGGAIESVHSCGTNGFAVGSRSRCSSANH